MTSRTNRVDSARRATTAAREPSERALLPSFTEELVHQLIGERVIVQSKDGQRFKGHLVRIHHWDRHVLLSDVEEHPGGATFPRVFVPHVDWIVQLSVDGSTTHE